MKVLMLTNVLAPDKLGGLERYVRELSSSLVRAGVRVTVASKRTDPDQKTTEVGDDGVGIVRYSAPPKSDPAFAAKYPSAISSGVREAIKQLGDHDGIVTHGHFPVPMLPVLARRQCFMYTCHAPVYKEIISERQGSYALPWPADRLAVAGMRAVERRVLRRASTVITLSEFIRSEVGELDSGAASRTRLVPGGIDLTQFLVRPHARYPRVLPGSGPVIFAARRMVLRTGVEQLVEAFALIRKSGIETRLVLAGDGPRRPAIEAFVRTHGLEGSVHLLGRISESELVAWYQSAYIAVTPTQELEGFGLSTAEAMACGAAPLVTPVGANAEVVRKLPSETVAGGSNPEDIADGLTQLLSDSELVERIRALAPIAAKGFGWDAISQRHIALYEDHLRRLQKTR